MMDEFTQTTWSPSQITFDAPYHGGEGGERTNTMYIQGI